MAYIKRWRKYRAEVESLAQSSDDEILPQNKKYKSFSHNSNSSLKHASNNQQPDNEEELNLSDCENDNDYCGDKSSTDADQNYHSDTDNLPDLITDIAGWATKNGCTRSALNELS